MKHKRELQRPEKSMALFLLLTLATSLFLSLSTAQAQVDSITTIAFIDANPNPVGAGQEVLLRYGVLQQLGYPEDQWTSISITIVDPEGNTQTLTGLTTDSTGGSARLFTPDKVGTYKLTTNFPEQTIPQTYFDFQRGALILEGTVVKAAPSETVELVVTEEPLPSYPGKPLPTEYWARPVDPQLREWYSITGNWVQSPNNALVMYNDYAPETAHVLWAKPLTTGGLTGGLWTDVPASSETGDAYAGKFIGSVILNGILYYNKDDEYAGSHGIVAVDLRNGEELWVINNTYLSFGQVFYFNSFNFDGIFTYLWDTSGGSTWKAYDPFSGQWIYTMTNMPSGTRVFGPSGEILIYQIDYENQWMALWNQTAVGQTAPGFSIDPTTYGSWHNFWGGQLVHGSTLNGSDPRAYTWNVTIPAGLTSSVGLEIYPDRVVSLSYSQTNVRVWALNIEGLTSSSTSTSTLFDKSWNAPTAWQEYSVSLDYSGATNEAENGVIGVWVKELRKHYGFSTETGNYLWETDSENILSAYGVSAEHSFCFAYGNLYSTGVAGVLYCYDQQTGDTLWTYYSDDPYNEPVTGNYWWSVIPFITEGKIYMGHSEHSAENPIPRGAPFVCLNATTGEVIWRVNGMFRQTNWGGGAVMGDSIIATMDTYDQRIYAIGKGPTATAVTAPDNGVPFGTSVMIRGTVTDISSGTEDTEIKKRFPNGVSAVSDTNQSAWMLYVYKQFEPDPHETWLGVPVNLYVVDANMNARSIGTATTSAENGAFAFAWTPDIPGTYYLYAEFAGSKAYYGSHAETAFVVDPEPEPTVAPTPEPSSAADLYFLPVSIGMITAIVVVIILVLLILLKKR